MNSIESVNDHFQLINLGANDYYIINQQSDSCLTILWFEEDWNNLIIDGKEYIFTKNQIVFLTEFHKVKVRKIGRVRFLRFKRSFYCIQGNDYEIGCRGILFFGSSQLPIIKITNDILEQLETLWEMFNIETQTEDSLQKGMLLMMLKRYLILCMRLYKSQHNFPHDKSDSDIIRKFNFLVEKHFRTKHSVKDYAELMHKSPKTISNIFSTIGEKTPLRYIQERKMLEARRLLRYTDLKVNQIAYKIGYEDIHTFSRYFKQFHKTSPSNFKNSL